MKCTYFFQEDHLLPVSLVFGWYSGIVDQYTHKFSLSALMSQVLKDMDGIACKTIASITQR